MTRARTWTLDDDPLGGTVRRTVLPNGLRVLTEAIPAMRSVSFGIWVAIGSRDEAPGLSGVWHFLEHLLFKGTARRTALDTSPQIKAVGGGQTGAGTRGRRWSGRPAETWTTPPCCGWCAARRWVAARRRHRRRTGRRPAGCPASRPASWSGTRTPNKPMWYWVRRPSAAPTAAGSPSGC